MEGKSKAKRNRRKGRKKTRKYRRKGKEGKRKSPKIYKFSKVTTV